MTLPTEQPRTMHYQVFVRDGAKCVYCDTSIMSSYDALSASSLDLLKPKHCGGADRDAWNRVAACPACANLKGSPDGTVTAETFGECVLRAREHVAEMRKEVRSNSCFRDYEYWLNKLDVEAV